MKRNKTKGATWRRLGEFIEECDERNSNGMFGEAELLGVNNQQTFCASRANTSGIDFHPYKVVRHNDLVYNPARLDIGSIARFDGKSCIVSTLYEVFKIRSDKQDELCSEFLQMYFARAEFARYVGFKNWGSAREYFWLDSMKRAPIPVPQFDVQREAVAAWQGLRKMKEENEGLVEPLLALCRSYLQECKKKYPMKEIGPYLTPRDERNSELRIKLSQGVANTKVFQDPKQVSSNSRADKIVHPGQFAYNRATTRNGEKISIAYREGPDCTVSSAYQVFSISDESYLNPYYLMLWVSRPEFDRYARYMSKGSAHEFFEFDEMCRVKIPLPPIEVQQAIVDVYRCAKEAKQIAAEADRLSREICPALVRWAAEGGGE